MIGVHVTVRSAILPGEGNGSVRGEDLQVFVPEPIQQTGSEQHLVEDVPQGVHFGVGLVVVVGAGRLNGVAFTMLNGLTLDRNMAKPS